MTSIIDARFEFLRGREGYVHSQFGEDGLVAALLERIGVKNRWCFEVGAADGVYLSNTKALRDQGWSAALIEHESPKVLELQRFASDTVKVFSEKIGPESLDRILAAAGAPPDLDLGSLDIDGQEYWCWKGLQRFHPRVMIVEYSPYAYTPRDFVPELDGKGQAALEPILKLGAEKGYIPAATTFCNVLFVRADCMEAA